ncbi:unnamed protein product, partial [Allacma fusca]
MKTIQFAVVYKNGTISAIPAGTFETYGEPKINPDDSDPVEEGVIVNLAEDMVEIICFFPIYESFNWRNASRKFIVHRSKAPSIHRKNTKNLFYIGDKGRTLSCQSDGTPRPKFQWFQNGSEISLESTGISFITSENESVLQLPELQEDLQGEYDCVVSNRVGQDNITFSLEVRQSKISPGIIATSA